MSSAGAGERVEERKGRWKGDIRVTVEDLITGETQSREIRDDYVLVVAGQCYVDKTMTYPGTGTHVVTIKGRQGRAQ